VIYCCSQGQFLLWILYDFVDFLQDVEKWRLQALKSKEGK